jgi:hypothetical protein
VHVLAFVERVSPIQRLRVRERCLSRRGVEPVYELVEPFLESDGYFVVSRGVCIGNVAADAC